MNCLQKKDILRYHKIKCYALYTWTTRKKQVFKKILFRRITRPYLSGVSLNIDLI